jgi:hypothetical protein
LFDLETVEFIPELPAIIAIRGDNGSHEAAPGILFFLVVVLDWNQIVVLSLLNGLNAIPKEQIVLIVVFLASEEAHILVKD